MSIPNHPQHPMPATPPALDPPFKGYIETTFDSLLVFEAARRGMIPRVTRRLIERERGMVQSGAVFVFDEQESGIKRWTDGLVWSPSRILGNFLVYRETDKRSANPPTPMSTTANSNSPNQHSPSASRPGTSGMPSSYGESSQMAGSSAGDIPPLGQGALQRPRSSSEGGPVDRQRERALVGSLTNSYKFKDGGLVKKTMSVTVNGYAQHMISYYTVEDVLAGKLRQPSTIPELASLEISPDYLHKQNFRFPPMIEVGQDGVPRYRGEAEEPTSPQTPMSGMTMLPYPPPDMAYDPYGPPPMPPAPLRMDSPRGSHSRSMTVPMPIPMSQPPTSYFPPGSTSSPYYDHGGMPPIGRQGSGSMPSGQNAMGAMRPGSSSNNRRFDPYGNPASPRVAANMIGHPHRRQSQPPPPPEGYFPAQTSAGAPPHPSPTTNTHPASYHYQPPSTAPGSFAEFYPPGAQGASHPAPLQSPMAAPAYTSSATPSTSYAAAPGQSWQGTPAQTSRLIPANQPRDFGPAGHPPSTAGSSGSGPHSQSGSAGGEWGTGTSGAGAGLADTIPTGTGAGSMIPPPPPTSQSTASAGPPSMWDSHGHAHTTGPHGGYVGVTSGGDDWRAGAGASMA